MERTGGKAAPKASGDPGHIKGVALCEFLEWYAAAVDQPRLERVVRELAATGAFDLERTKYGLLASAWYPAPLVHRLLDALVGELDDKQQLALAQQAADHIMARTLRGIYKVMFSMLATPDRYLRHVGKLWAQHYDTGTPVIRVLGPGAHHVMYRDWRGHHPFICRMNMASARPIYTAMGCRGVVWQRQSCVSLGGSECASIVRWSGPR